MYEYIYAVFIWERVTPNHLLQINVYRNYPAKDTSTNARQGFSLNFLDLGRCSELGRRAGFEPFWHACLERGLSRE